MSAYTMLDVPQRSPEWFAARAGRLTGAGAAAMCARGGGLSRAALLARLVAERRAGRSRDGGGFCSADMQRGIALEPAAVAAYEAVAGRLVRRSGFLSHNSLLVGCSLDGYVGAVEGILEVKCPRSLTHFEYLHGRKVPAGYLRQIEHNLWVSGARWCDFISYDDRFPPPYDVVVVRVERSPAAITRYERQALAFLADVDRAIAAGPALSIGAMLRASLAVSA